MLSAVIPGSVQTGLDDLETHRSRFTRVRTRSSQAEEGKLIQGRALGKKQVELNPKRHQQALPGPLALDLWLLRRRERSSRDPRRSSRMKSKRDTTKLVSQCRILPISRRSDTPARRLRGERQIPITHRPMSMKKRAASRSLPVFASTSVGGAVASTVVATARM
jgi:hypothetical protein